MKEPCNHLFIISGPSGVGKSTLASKLLNDIPSLKKSISYTTRSRRDNEVDGVDYHFVGVEEFKRKIANQEFIEWVEIYGNYYGTTYSSLRRMLAENDLLMVIDVIGAKNIKRKYPAVSVLTYILPPSLEELERRLLTRACNTTKEDLERRLTSAKEELKMLAGEDSCYDYVIKNDDFDRCYERLKSIIIAKKSELSQITDDLLLYY